MTWIQVAEEEIVNLDKFYSISLIPLLGGGEKEGGTVLGKAVETESHFNIFSGTREQCQILFEKITHLLLD